MRQPAPVQLPTVLTIAGSDSGGGAGIQADIKTIEARGGFAMSVITAVTAQNTQGVRSSHVLPIEEIEAQLEAIDEDFTLDAIKTGMLATTPVIETVIDFIADRSTPLVVDPVMVAASGDRLLDPSAEGAYQRLLDHATLVTPNADEAAVLVDHPVKSIEQARRAAVTIQEMGANATLVKGGHLPGDRVTNVLATDEEILEFTHPRVAGEATHGSGCTLASAIATGLATGRDTAGAVEAGLSFMQQAVRYPISVGLGAGPVHHLVELRSQAERSTVIEEVTQIVNQIDHPEVHSLVPAQGMNIVGVTQYAESPADAAAVIDRLTTSDATVEPGRRIGLGASDAFATFLFAIRDEHPTLRFVVNLRYDGGIAKAIQELDVATVELAIGIADDESDHWEKDHWAPVRQEVSVATPPSIIIDRGSDGTEPTALVMGTTPTAVVRLVTSIAEALNGDN